MLLLLLLYLIYKLYKYFYKTIKELNEPLIKDILICYNNIFIQILYMFV